MKPFNISQVTERRGADIDKQDIGVPTVSEEMCEEGDLGCTCPNGVREGVLSGVLCEFCKRQLEQEEIPY
jgi:hypothetical protein